MLAQHFVDARLPALALLAIGGQHIRVDTDSLIDLAIFLARAASATPELLADVLAEDLA